MAPKPPRANTTWGTMARFTHIGITYALAVLLGYFVGSRVDNWLHSSPVFSLIGVFVMMGGGIYWMYIKLKAMEESPNEKSQSPKSHSN